MTNEQEVINHLASVIRMVHDSTEFWITGSIKVERKQPCPKCGNHMVLFEEGGMMERRCLQCSKIIEIVQTDDVKICPKCGGIAIRHGACHTCHSCGESLGCS